jgi:hypothetical protein
MRGIYALVCVVALAACRSFGAGPTPADRCNAKASAGWQRLADVPENAKDLMQLPAGQGRTVASWWSVATPPVAEVWFARDAVHLKACLFTDVSNYCYGDVTSVEFTRVASGWKAGTVLSTVCVADERESR